MTSPGTQQLPAVPGADRAARWQGLVRARLVELARFSSVGAVAFVVDMGTYNLLRFGPSDVLGDHPLTARVIAVVLATLVSWLGSRYWTFADQRSGRQGREAALFAVINVLGMGVTVGVLAFWHAVLGLSGPWWDNVANIVGIGLGTVVRYVGYKLFVFTGTATLPTSLVEIAHEVHGTPVYPVIAILPHPHATPEGVPADGLAEDVSDADGSARPAGR
jgi:putative flippase GtrA